MDPEGHFVCWPDVDSQSFISSGSQFIIQSNGVGIVRKMGTQGYV